MWFIKDCKVVGALVKPKGIGKAKRHYQELVMALVGSKSNFGYVFWAYSNLVIASS